MTRAVAWAFLPAWLRSWPFLAFLASAAMLAAAHAFETFGHYPPCSLCLKQRDVYWAAIAAGMAGAGAAMVEAPRLVRAASLLLGLIFVIGAAIAIYHAGVEWKFWAGPSTCAGGGVSGLSGASIDAALNGTMHVVACDEAAWRLFGISMAGYNALISAALAALSFWSIRRHG